MAIHIVSILVYTGQFIHVFRSYSKFLQFKFKIIMVILELSLIARAVNLGVRVYHEDNSHYSVEVRVYSFINRNVFVQIFIWVMFILKRVEYQMNPKYEDED